MKPTDSELTILNIIWNDGASTVRHVNERLNKERRVGYTNTLKMMQLMHDKGMLIRDESSRSHIYDTQLASSEIRNHFLKDMVNSVFDGNTSKLLIQALGSYKPSKEEIEEIKTILNNLEKNDGTAADTE